MGNGQSRSIKDDDAQIYLFVCLPITIIKVKMQKSKVDFIKTLAEDPHHSLAWCRDEC